MSRITTFAFFYNMNLNKKHIVAILKKHRLLVIFTVLFLAWISFLDTNSFYTIHKYHKRINELKEDKKFYIEKIIEDSIKLQQINSPEQIEKFARERYFMKADNEDVFVIIDKSAKK